jgi:hypothetical protein
MVVHGRYHDSASVQCTVHVQIQVRTYGTVFIKERVFGGKNKFAHFWTEELCTFLNQRKLRLFKTPFEKGQSHFLKKN